MLQQGQKAEGRVLKDQGEKQTEWKQKKST